LSSSSLTQAILDIGCFQLFISLLCSEAAAPAVVLLFFISGGQLT
jgi:hypothetical protein